MSLSLVIVVVLGNVTQNKDDGPKPLDGRGSLSRNLKVISDSSSSHKLHVDDTQLYI